MLYAMPPSSLPLQRSARPAFHEYGFIRDHLSRQFARATEALASLDLSVDSARARYLELQVAMTKEVEGLEGSLMLAAA
jgi:hypothetical protein